MNADEEAISALLAAYARALNASDTEAVMELYAPDGIFMPQFAPTALGAAAVRAAYDAVFSTIVLSVAFAIAEIRQTGDEWAFARTNSAGTVVVKADGTGGPEANQELFVFQKVAGAWKIARYCFCSTNPPRARA